MPGRELKKDREASRARGGQSTKAHHGNQYRASEHFDWDNALARFQKILDEVYGKEDDQ